MKAPTLRSASRLGALGVTLLAALWVGSIAADNTAVQGLILQGGYLGVFLFSIINGFNVIVPMVSASFVPALTHAGLDPVITILVMTAGMTVADSTAFFLGRLGRANLGERASRMSRTLARAEERRHWFPLLILFLWAAFVPLPTEIVAVSIGLMGYPAYQVVPLLSVAVLIFNVLVGFGFVNAVAWL